jgi:integrase
MREDNNTGPEHTEWTLPPEPSPSGAGSAMMSADEFGASVRAAHGNEIDAEIATTVRKRLRQATLDNYAYWLGRLTTWMTKPDERHRLRTVGAVDPDTLWPMTRGSEELICHWLLDMYRGPTDPAEHEKWQATRGPIGPGTLNNIISALKARAQDQGAPWALSTHMKNYLKGLRRQLRDASNPLRQAEPLLARHVRMICDMLVQPGGDAARDRLVLELLAAEVTNGEIGRLRSAPIVEPDHRPDHDADTDDQVRSDSLSVSTRSLMIPGQGRRGGKCDPARLIVLAEHPNLEAALDAYLSFQRPEGAEHGLLQLTQSNPNHHLRKILIRLAALAGIEWRPSRHTRPTSHDIAAMRSLFDDPTEWDAYLHRQRDHVMLLVGYLCALRRSELCALTIRDVTFVGDDAAIITIQLSKTNPNSERLPLRRDPSGPAQSDAVTLLRRWIDRLKGDGADPATPLFPALDRHGQVLTRRDKDGVQCRYPRLDPETWSKRLRQLACEAQVFGDDDERYDGVSGHSLRRGFVTTAVLAGAATATIMAQTRHKDHQAFMMYVDELRLLEGTNWTQTHFGTSGNDKNNETGPAQS